MKYLDCTLRDGGYYNNWNFPLEVAKKTIFALDAAKVDIIEVGYKSPNKKVGNGLFKYCNEEYLSFLRELEHAECAFMVDVKEYLKDGGINKILLEENIKKSSDSVFKWVRLATHFNTVKETALLVNWFADLGYKICVNLMGCSLLTNEQLKEALSFMEASKIEYFYFADSFGSFYKEDVERLVHTIKENYDGKIGIHTHDNQGMALSNSLVSLDNDVGILDGTITGMGRGAGNLMTEQFLLCAKHSLSLPFGSLQALESIIEDYYMPLKEEHKWGYNTHYMLSGLWDIHPTYVQKLVAENRFTTEEINDILKFISKRNTKKFDQGLLNDAVKSLLDSNVNVGRQIPEIEPISLSSCLIVANASYLRPKKEELEQFLRMNQNISLLECNDLEMFGDLERFLVVLNKNRLKAIKTLTKVNRIVTGQSSCSVNEIYALCAHQPFRVGETSSNSNEIEIPDYDVGMFAIMWAIKNGAKRILLAGFIGRKEKDQNTIMMKFFDHLQTSYPEVELISVSPSLYDNLKQRSLYAY